MGVKYNEGGERGMDFGIIFTVNDEVFGFVSMSKMLSKGDKAFMQSDFVINSTQKRLSKLVVMLMKSDEIRILINREFKHWYKGIRTAVFTKNPVSIKYRGVLKRVKKEEGKLTYESDYNNLTIEENYKLWLKRLIV